MIQPDAEPLLTTASTGGPAAASRPGDAPTLRGPEPGQRVFGRYVLEKILGRGGMGVVWAAFDETLRERVALKFLPDAVRWDPAAFDDLKAETRRARSLTHPNIVRIHDFVEDASFAAISMELVDGRTLTEVRLEKAHKIFEPADIVPWLPQLCAALDYAHTQAKVVHRDLKPANIMLTRDGVVKIADFGVARSLADSITRVSMMSAGTLVYMSPQQAMGEEPAASDDIYALGATLYELLTGKPPFHTGDVRMQLFQRKPDTIAARRKALGIAGPPVIPRGWEETIGACLAKDAAARPATAGAVIEMVGGRVPAPAVAAHAHRARPSVMAFVSDALSRAPIARPTRRTAVLLAALVFTSQLAVWSLWRGPDYADAARNFPRQSRAAPVTRLVSRISFDDDIRDEGSGFQNLGAGLALPVLDRHGRADRAMRFNGSASSAADAGPELRWSLRTPFTVALWVRLDARPVTGCVLVVCDPQKVGPPAWNLSVGLDLRPIFAVARLQVENRARRQTVGARPLEIGRWYHVAGVSDGTETRLLIDGEIAGREPIVDPDTPAPARARLRVGGGEPSERSWLVGALDELRVYRGALPAVEVRALAQAMPARFVRSSGLYSDEDDLAPVIASEFGPAARQADWFDLKASVGPDVARLADEFGMGTGGTAFFVTRAGSRNFDGRRYYSMVRFDGIKPAYYLAHDELGGHIIALGSWYGSRQGLMVRVPLPPPRVERVDFSTQPPAGWSVGASTRVESGRLVSQGGAIAVTRAGPVEGDTVSGTWRGWLDAGGRALGHRVELTNRSGEVWVAACESVGGGRDVLRVTLGRRDGAQRVAEIRPTYGELRFTLVARAGSLRWRVATAGGGLLVADERLELPGWKPSDIVESRWLATAEAGAATWLADVEWREERGK